MRIPATLVLVMVALVLCGCGDSHNVTIVNECQETVDIQIKAQSDETVSVNGIKPGQEDGCTVGLGPMDVKAVFQKDGKEITSGFKSESGGEYRLTIRGNPPGIFLSRE